MKKGDAVRIKKHGTFWMPYEMQNFPVGSIAKVSKVMKSDLGKTLVQIRNAKLGRLRRYATFTPAEDLELVDLSELRKK